MQNVACPHVALSHVFGIGCTGTLGDATCVFECV